MLTERAEGEPPENAEDQKANTFQVPVLKAKETVEVNILNLPEAVMREVIAQGLKVLVNRGPGISKVTKENYPDEKELHEKAMVVALEQVENLKSGNIKLSVGGKKAK